MNISKSIKKSGVIYIVPAMIVVAAVMFYPLIYTLIMGFFENTLYMESPRFCGFSQYAVLFGDKVFLKSIGNTIVWTAGSVIFQFSLGFLFALLLHQPFVKGKTVLRILLMVPWVLPSIIGASVWQWMYNADYGILNFIFKTLGIIEKNRTWLAGGDTAMLSVVGLTLLLSILAGYGLSRYRFKGSGLVQTLLLFGQMVPGVVIIIPLYFAFSKMHLLDMHVSLIVADLALTIPMGVIMLTSFFKGVPRELEEAAKMDGCTGVGALFRVILPIAKPGIVSVTIYTFINAWEEFLFALNLSMSEKTRTLPIAINTFAGEFSVDWGATMAAATVVALPVLALFLLCNKYFVQGLSDGAVKG